jgi:hypothetical protein
MGTGSARRPCPGTCSSAASRAASSAAAACSARSSAAAASRSAAARAAASRTPSTCARRPRLRRACLATPASLAGHAPAPAAPHRSPTAEAHAIATRGARSAFPPLRACSARACSACGDPSAYVGRRHAASGRQRARLGRQRRLQRGRAAGGVRRGGRAGGRAPRVRQDARVEAEALGDRQRIGRAGRAPNQPVRGPQRGQVELHARVLEARVARLRSAMSHTCKVGGRYRFRVGSEEHGGGVFRPCIPRIRPGARIIICASTQQCPLWQSDRS